MPRASGQKFAYMDHDTDVVDEEPPVQNTWYEVYHAYDVRLLVCSIFQTNDENAAKDVEVRWTIEGNVYFSSFALEDNTRTYIYRSDAASAGGTAGLWSSASQASGCFYVDKRGLDFKVEVRITSALGTNQRLQCRAVRETLVLT